MLPELTENHAENIQYSMKDMKYFEEENEYVLALRVATRDSPVQQNHSAPLKLNITGLFEKKGDWIFQSDEAFEMEVEIQYLNNVT